MPGVRNRPDGQAPRIAVAGTVPKSFGMSVVALKRAAAFFAARSRARIGNPRWNEVTVVLVRDAESDEAHRAIMGVEGATDVITQAYDSIPPEPPGLCGELIVNTDQALRAAPRRKGWSAAKELLLYVAHGMDHLSGADDHSERDYRAMRRRELAWIRALESNAAHAAIYGEPPSRRLGYGGFAGETCETSGTCA